MPLFLQILNKQKKNKCNQFGCLWHSNITTFKKIYTSKLKLVSFNVFIISFINWLQMNYQISSSHCIYQSRCIDYSKKTVHQNSLTIFRFTSTNRSFKYALHLGTYLLISERLFSWHYFASVKRRELSLLQGHCNIFAHFCHSMT